MESRQSDIDALNSQWDIRNITYTIISHRPFYGRMLVKGRQLVNGEVRRYVDPVIGNQSRFNKRIAQIFTQYEKRTSNLEESLDQLKNDSIKEDKDLRFLITGLEKRQEQISTQLKQILSEIADNHNTTIDLNKKLNQIIEKHLLNDQEVVEKKINTILSNLELVITNKLRIPIIEEPESRDYFAFEEHFRGPEKIIKERQRRYLPFFENCLNVLDIGCGRGSFSNY